jgi:glycosyltransferase involved in cell wall biosynthesis
MGHLPRVVYFHENQLTYPDRRREERDFHYAMTNFTSALAADQVWFNSAYHRRVFYAAMSDLLRKMPDHRLLDQLAEAEQQSLVRSPGIESPPAALLDQPACEGPLHIIWAARWEHDKAPETLFAALEILAAEAVDFRLSVIGESFRESPVVFETMHQRYADKIIRWGFQSSRQEYWHALAEADLFVSTAEHEFFGIAAVEAAAVGTRVLLPERLAYPEVFGLIAGNQQQYFYDGTPNDLAKKLAELHENKQCVDPRAFASTELSSSMKRFHWPALVPQYDAELASLSRSGSC